MNEQPDTEQIRAQLAAEISRVIGDRNLTDAAASRHLGIPAADVSALRNARPGAFSIDQLIALLNAFDQRVEVKVRPPAGNVLLSIVGEMATITAQIPPEEREKLPTDLAANHDHYLYGGPRRD
jgi:predicted XRE-type DNA-binding protein